MLVTEENSDKTEKECLETVSSKKICDCEPLLKASSVYKFAEGNSKKDQVDVSNKEQKLAVEEVSASVGLCIVNASDSKYSG